MSNKFKTVYMNTYKIFNSTSEDMSAIPDSSVDVAIFAPPYNIDTPYDNDHSDHKPFEEFKSLLNGVIKECCRVLKPGGVFINESADTIYSKNKFIALSDLIQKLCLDTGLSLQARHINFIQSQNGMVLTDKEHHWTSEYYSEEDSHSNCHQWLMFRKGEVQFNPGTGKIFYVNYPADEEGHPCPFSYEHINIFLEMSGFQEGMSLVEPFMGTGRMGEEVLRRGGNYFGYEIAEKHFKTAQNRLENLKTGI